MKSRSLFFTSYPRHRNNISIFTFTFKKCIIYASVNWVSVGTENGLSPVQPFTEPKLVYCHLGP